MKRHGLIRFIAIVLFVIGFLALLGGILGGTSFANGGFGSGWGPGTRAWLAWPFIGAGLSTALFLWFLGAVLWLLAAIDANLAEARARGLDLRLARRARTVPAPAGSLIAPGAVAAGAPAAGAAVAGAAVAGAAVAGAAAAKTAEAPEPAPAAPEPAPAPGPDVPPVVTAAIPPVVTAAVPDKSAPAPEAETPAGEAPATATEDTGADAAAAAHEAADKAAEGAPEAPAADAGANAAGAAQDAAYAPQVEISGHDLDEAEDNGTGEEGPAGEFSGRLPGSDQAARVAAEMKAQKPADEDNPPAATM